jgi:hypothetical protein
MKNIAIISAGKKVKQLILSTRDPAPNFPERKQLLACIPPIKSNKAT